MSKGQTSRLTEQHIAHGGASGIFSDDAQIHDKAVGRASKYVYERLNKQYPDYKFRLRKDISKQEINNKLKSLMRNTRLITNSFIQTANLTTLNAMSYMKMVKCMKSPNTYQKTAN